MEKEYHITHQPKVPSSELESVYHATNRAQNLKTTFSTDSVNIIPKNETNPSWQTIISLENIGRGKHIIEVPNVSSSRIDGPRMEFQRGSICEWYENRPKGIEQGFTILEKPSGNGPLELGLLTKGSTKPVLSTEGDTVEFITAANQMVLTYSKLHVFDSNGQSLLSRFEVEDQYLSIIIDDTSATYPITVDPLFAAPEWTWSNNATSVSTAGDVNGDGYSDVIIGDAFYGDGGSVFVFYGSESGLSTSPDWEDATDVANAWFGYSVATAGDVNGDGYSDVIVGASEYANGNSWEGAAYVYYGSISGLSLTPAWSAESNETGASFGRSVGTAGDINGDGYSDIIIGAPCNEYHSRRTGNVYVFHGSASGLGDNGTPGNADWVAQGDQLIAFFGDSVATAGDVNGDGYSDIIVGAPYYDSPESNEGKVFAYYGSATGLGSNGTPSNADWSEDGYDLTNLYFGDSVSTAGDINGDGYSDVVIGGPGYNVNRGIASVYLGSSGGISTFHRYYYGAQELDLVGESVGTAGDINGDGYADIIIGSGQSNAIHVVKGAGTGLPSIGQISTRASWSKSQSSSFGDTVGTAGDIDGDGLSDIIAGGDNAYVYYGSFPGIETTASQTIDGGEDYRRLGFTINSAGDVNADGYMDVIVGDRGYDGSFSSEGIAYVYYGSASGVNTTTPDWSVTGGEQSARLGYSVNSAGDVNGDGYGDIIIGAPGYGDYGAAFVYFGSATGISGPPDIVVGDANQGEVSFGEVVAPAGNVDGDGYDDVIVSAPIYNVTPNREGAVFLYKGSSEGLVTTPAWDVFGGEGSYRYGTNIGTAGDVNGDGYDDFFVTGTLNTVLGIFVYYGTSQALSETASWIAEDSIYAAGTAGDVNNDGFSDIIVGDTVYSGNTGRIAIFHGSSSGLDLNGSRPVGSFGNADWSINGNTADSYFGISVSTAGDANRDGYADIIVGETYSYSTASSGKAHIYYGSVSGITSIDPWSYEHSQADNNADFGQPVISAGDINGDGFSDILIGADEYSGTTYTNEGRIFFFYGNDGGGSSTPLPKQLETDGATEIDKMGMSDDETSFVFSSTGRTPFGRGDVRVEWEAKPADQPFDGTNTFTSTGWQDSGIAGHVFTEQVTGLVGHTPYKWRIRYLFKADNPMGLKAGAWHVPFAEGHYYLKTNNTAPIGGYTSDNIIPTDQGQIVQSTQENESGLITIFFRIKDAGINECTLHTFQYSVNGGSDWKSPTSGDESDSLGGSWPDNDGTLYSSASDWAGTVHSFTLNTKHSDVQADFLNVDQSDVRVRFTVNDGLEDSAAPVTSNPFRVDDAVPSTGTISILDNSGATNDATPALNLSSNGASHMRFALSEGGLSSATWVPYSTNYSSFDISSGSNGTKTIWVEFRDQYWNIRPTHASDMTVYDTSPIVTGDDITNDTTPTWSWTSVDNDNGTGSFRYQLDSSGWSEATDNLFYTPPGVLSEGIHTLSVQEWSEEGYWSDTGSFTIEIDSGIPCSEASSPEAVDDLNQTFTITYTYDDIYAGETCGSADSGSGLSTVDLWVKAPADDTYSLVQTDSDGDIDGQFSYTAGDQGAYDFYTIATDYAGNVELATGSDTQTIFASEFSGYAILAVGAYGAEEEGLDSHTLTANNVYKHLINRNFALVDDDVDKWTDPLDYIKYYNPYSEIQTGEDDYTEGDTVSYWQAMQKAISQWALNKMTVLPGPLYIILIDHGTENNFYLKHPSYFTASELDGWLTTLEDGLDLAGVDENIVIVLGTCYSGSFIDELSKSGRIIVSSSAADEPSYRGPLEPSGIRDGEFFISSLFNELGRGENLKTSFLNAVERVDIHTFSGYTNSAEPYFDAAMQHPYLDDDGLLPGSYNLVPGGDGDIAKNIILGYETSANDPVVVTECVGLPDTIVDNSLHSTLLWAKVSDIPNTDRVWVEIRDPGTTLEGGTEQQLVDLNEFSLTLNGDRYEATYNDFWTEGKYTLFFYAKDTSGLISPFKKSYVYKEQSGPNTPPDVFNLLSPADSTEVPITTILDWEDTQDTTDGHSISYTVTISTNSDISSSGEWVYREEGIENSVLNINASNGIQNQTTYYWQVTAVDEYGASTATAVWSFDTDNVSNPVIGFIKGFVYDATTNEAITSATININNGSLVLNSSLNGYYLGSFEPGNFPITVTADGYQDFQSNLDMPEGITVTMNFSLTPGTTGAYPIASIDSPSSSVIILPGESISFQGSVTGGTLPFTYLWDFSGGATNSTQKDPSGVTFAVEGVYVVTFTVTDNDGNIDSDSVTVTVDAAAPDNDGDGISNTADPDDDNDGISDAVESAGPNSGDANNDSTQDSLQDNVACIASYNAQGYVVLETPPGITLSNCQAANNPSPGDAPADINFDYGFFDFTISGITPGGSTTLTMTLPSGVEPDTYYKYGQTQANQTDHWYEFLYDTQTGAEINGNVITLNFMDALRGDDVLTQDSMVIDLGAPGFDVTAVDLEPTATITSPASNTTITAGGSVNFQGSVTSGNSPFTYSWNFGGGASNVNSEDPGSVTFSTAGTYTVTFTVTDVDNDTDSDTVTITVNASDDGGDDGGGGGSGGGGGCFIDTLFSNRF